MWTITQELYAATLADLEAESISCLGGDCALVDVATLFTNRIRFVVLPNSQLIAERADSSEPDVAGRALDACFNDSGLEPSPDEAALIVSSLWSQFAGTLSFKKVLEELGFGPTYHMQEAMRRPVHVRTWLGYADTGDADWDSLFADFNSGVDYPTP